ncbi:MAG TPA: cytochrome c oxidase subunit 3 [Pyrinomonadaceae bacterium]|jgi:cytochrome c oxidase subunit 3
MVAAVQKEYKANVASDNRYRLGAWVLLAAVVMLFTSLSSAYVVRIAATNDWQPLPLPKILFVSTAIILISSFTIEIAKRKVGTRLAHSRWLLVTAILGVAFLFTQLLAWRQLARQGLYLASNSRSSFFYLLSGIHGIHLAGGLLAITFVFLRSRRLVNEELSGTKGRGLTDATAIYWHFMDALWIYLFLLLFFWR